jgi:dTDP-4-dehydrorhamnose reductase
MILGFPHPPQILNDAAFVRESRAQKPLSLATMEGMVDVLESRREIEALKLLVIGAGGQLACSLLQVKKPEGARVDAVGRAHIDILDSASIDRAIERHEPNFVVNTAAYTAVDKAESEPTQAYAINADGAAFVAEACGRRNVPLIHISTDYVFDGSNAPYREDSRTAPVNIYGASKLEGERRVAAACPQHLILRTAWLYSPFFGHNFIKTILRAASRSEVAVVDDQTGNPTYAPYLTAAIIAIIDRILKSPNRSQFWGTYHVAGSGEATWYSLAQEVFRQSAALGGPSVNLRPITTAEYPTPGRRPADTRLDCSKSMETFGVHLPHWSKGVAECVARLEAQKTVQDSETLK